VSSGSTVWGPKAVWFLWQADRKGQAEEEVNELDLLFIAKVRSGVEARLGEDWVRSMFAEYTQVKACLRLRLGCGNHVSFTAFFHRRFSIMPWTAPLKLRTVASERKYGKS
jgi:hypothetical protein